MLQYVTICVSNILHKWMDRMFQNLKDRSFGSRNKTSLKNNIIFINMDEQTWTIHETENI